MLLMCLTVALSQIAWVLPPGESLWGSLLLLYSLCIYYLYSLCSALRACETLKGVAALGNRYFLKPQSTGKRLFGVEARGFERLLEGEGVPRWRIKKWSFGE